MISLLKNLLQINKYRVNQINNKILITAGDALYPEDYIEVNYQNELIVVSEVHRASSKIIINTPIKEKAIIYASVLCMRLFEPLSRDTKVEELKNYIKNKEINCANVFLENIFSNDTYIIGEEDFLKISLITNEEKANVKYRNEYLAQNAGLVRAYGVLYNYSKKLENIREWYKKVDMNYLSDVKRDEIEELYILGRINNLDQSQDIDFGKFVDLEK